MKRSPEFVFGITRILLCAVLLLLTLGPLHAAAAVAFATLLAQMVRR